MKLQKIGAALTWAGFLLPSSACIAWTITGQSNWYAIPLAAGLVLGLAGIYTQYVVDRAESEERAR